MIGRREGREGGLEVEMGQPGGGHLRGRENIKKEARKEGGGGGMAWRKEGRNEKGGGGDRREDRSSYRITSLHMTCLQVTLRSGKELWMCWWGILST